MFCLQTTMYPKMKFIDTKLQTSTYLSNSTEIENGIIVVSTELNSSNTENVDENIAPDESFLKKAE